MQQFYPDISDLLEAKARRRRELAALPWEEKIRIIEQMQQLLPKSAWKVISVQKANVQSSKPNVAGSIASGHIG